MRKPLFVLVAAMSAAAFGSACGDDPKRPAAASDSPSGRVGAGTAAGGGSGDAGGSDGGGDADAGACTALSNTGKVVPQNAVNDDLLPGTGGVVLDGTYDLVEAWLYQGASGALPGLTGNSFQGSIRITGTAYERVVLFGNGAGAPSESRVTGTFTAGTNAVNAEIKLSCPVAALEQVTYSVLNNSLTVSNRVTKESFVFLKQP